MIRALFLFVFSSKCKLLYYEPISHSKAILQFLSSAFLIFNGSLKNILRLSVTWPFEVFTPSWTLFHHPKQTLCSKHTHTCISCLMNPLTLSPQHSENPHRAEIKRNARWDASPCCRKSLALVCLKQLQTRVYHRSGCDYKLLRLPMCSPHADPDCSCRFHKNISGLRFITCICLTSNTNDSRITNHIHES